MLRILLLSDLHAITGDPDSPEAASNFTALSPEFENPVREAGRVIRNAKLDVDWVVCPGDLSDKANPIAQQFAWEQLEKLRVAVGARKLIGTAGNHDVDSRLKHGDFDPKGNLQSLTPPFPGLDEMDVDRYWSRNFACIVENDVCLVVLNSAAFHGFISDEKVPQSAEYLHGRVSDKTIEAIVSSVKNVRAKLHIILAHHHILPAEDVYKTSTSDMMLGGQTLLKRLSEVTERRWIVLHGHQHFPRLRYFPEKGYPVIFSAGSVSARLAPRIVGRAGNQFYYLEFELGNTPDVGWEGCGTVRAWHWVRGTGWLPTLIGSNTGIPYGAGFGYIGPAAPLAKRLADIMSNENRSYVTHSEMCKWLPEVRFLNPDDFESLITACDAHGIRYMRSMDARDPEGSSCFMKV